MNLSGMFNFSTIHLQFLPLKTYQMLKNVQKENKWSKLHCTKCIFWKSILTLPLNFQFVRLCVYRYWYFWRNTLQCVKIIYEDVFKFLMQLWFQDIYSKLLIYWRLKIYKIFCENLMRHFEGFDSIVNYWCWTKTTIQWGFGKCVGKFGYK